MKKGFLFFCLSLLVFLSTSCTFSKLLKSDDNEKKYATALQLFNDKDYSRALQLFDQLMGVMRATDKAQKIYYDQAYCYYYSKDYTMAAYYFKRFSTNFPNSREAEECTFMSAFCNCQNSPDYNLDQTITKDAIKELQAFINTYPESKRLPECNELMDKMREKLETKDYKISLLYYRMDDYMAAITSFNNVLKDYPETQKKEEIMFLIFKCYNIYGDQSIDSKKQERIMKAFSAFNDFAILYPNSKYMADAKSLKEKSQKELELLALKTQKKNTIIKK
jgi:outer membrane protein assembly factor BamD